MSRDTWYKCDPTDLLDGISDLDDPELVAIYVVAINRIYQSGGPISNSEKHIGQFCGMHPRRARKVLDDLVERGKLYLVDGKLMNARCADELTGRERLSKTRAKAGSEGGKRTSNGAPTHLPRTSHDPASTVGAPSQPRLTGFRDEEMAENRGSAEANASTRARERDREKEEPPYPPLERKPILVWNKPNFDDPDEPFDRAEAIAKLDIVDRRDANPNGVDVPDLTSRVMMAANMAVPPTDLILVSSWVRLGIDPDLIVKTATRMAATARGPVRAMRYFDAEIRRLHDTAQSLENKQIEEFRRIARQAQQG